MIVTGTLERRLDAFREQTERAASTDYPAGERPVIREHDS